MKKRAAVVGRRLGAEVLPGLAMPGRTRLRLVRHGFGVRLVTAAAGGLWREMPPYSLCLLQGALCGASFRAGLGGRASYGIGQAEWAGARGKIGRRRLSPLRPVTRPGRTSRRKAPHGGMEDRWRGARSWPSRRAPARRWLPTVTSSNSRFRGAFGTMGGIASARDDLAPSPDRFSR